MIPSALRDGVGLIAQIADDWRTNGRDWTRPGFQALAVHRFGNWRMRIEPRIVRAPFSLLYRALFDGVRNFYGIELPYTAKVGKSVIIEHQGGIVIHGGADIGDGCVLRQGVTVGNRTLDRPFDAPRLGARVNVGAGAKILGSVAIGDDAQIGANAVVLTDVPAGSLAAGVPALVVRRTRTSVDGGWRDRGPVVGAEGGGGEVGAVAEGVGGIVGPAVANGKRL
jgi:serine acetyltransferase